MTASEPEVEKVKSAFRDFALSEPVLKAIKEAGYETPTPIQAEIIPLMLAGKDVLGEAQTGTGKTAAFALPLLTNIDLSKAVTQVLVLTPTRELAIQVAEAFQGYAAHLKNFHVTPIYGGQDYAVQLRSLRRGVHVVVGTPGRVMDHIRRNTLKLDDLKCLVLDEGDEMLRMGFIDDVEWVLEQTPPDRQLALFSATMPAPVRRIAQKHLRDPVEITIKVKTTTAETIRQRFWMVSGMHKLDALTRILGAEPFDAILVFVRTKLATAELSQKLEARGYASAPLSGDITQRERERTVNRLKSGKIDILVATDVAARGLDVERISHVINYDIPYDTEAYVHRVGRTGRAGREGEAILFVQPRERRLLNAIEKATRQKIERMEMPTTEDINDKRVARFKQRITDTLAEEELEFFKQLIEQYQQEHDVPAEEIAGALAHMVQGDQPLLLPDEPKHKKSNERDWDRGGDRGRDRDRREDRERGGDRGRDRERPRDRDRSEGGVRSSDRVKDRPKPAARAIERGMERYRLDVGSRHGVEPKNIAGAIINEAELDKQYVGRIDIHDDYSTVDLPEGMPKEVMNVLKKAMVMGRPLNIAAMAGRPGKQTFTDKKDGPPRGKKKFDKSKGGRKSKKKPHRGQG